MLTLDAATLAAFEQQADERLRADLLAFFMSRPELAATAAKPETAAFVAQAIALARAQGLRLEQDVARFTWLALLFRRGGDPAPRDPCAPLAAPCCPDHLRMAEHALRERLRSPA